MTDPWLTFHPILPPSVSIGLLVIVCLTITWLEWKRMLPFRLVRLVLLAIALIALYGILLRPHYKTERFDIVALLTRDYSQESADSLIEQYPGISFLHTPEIEGYKNSIGLKSWNQLSTYSSIDFILGRGLPPIAQELIPKKSFQFLPAPIKEGITHVSPSSPVFPHRNNVVEGTFFSTDSSKIKLYLEGPGGMEDSVMISKPGHQNFKLHFSSKQAGNFLYKLRSSNGMNETFPVHVEDHIRSKILFIQQYPTFESRYLKSVLGKQHALVVRYQLSKNTTRFEYINHKSVQIKSITPESLASFDLVIIDTDALQNLPSQEVQVLQQGIREGLGVILSFNQPPTKVKTIKKLSSLRFNPASTDTAQFQINSGRKISLPAWKFSPASENPIIPTLRNKNRILSGYEMTGLGKIGFQLLQESYQLLLKGDSISYQELWSTLVEQTSRSVKDNFTIQISTAWPWFPDEPIDIKIVSTGLEPELFQDDHQISLSEDVLIDDVWKATIRVGHPGWHSLLIKNDSTRFYFYVSEKNRWQSLASANIQNQTALMAGASTFKNLPQKVNQPINQLMFYAMFVLAVGILWFLPKR